MEFIDTHTHLYLDNFDTDRNEVVERALKNQVNSLLLPNIDLKSIPAMLEMYRKFPGICFPMIGLHPGSVKENFEKELYKIENWLEKINFIAIGETGIDLYWDKRFKEQQLEAFEIQIKWAKEKKLPIVIHARNSFSEIYSVLDKHADKNLKGVFHSFTGNSDDLEKVLSYGFFVGINGIVTFSNSGLEHVVKYLPPEKLLLETDSPYLAPVPERGKRNESSFVTHIAYTLARIYGLSINEIAEITTKNAGTLFNLEHFVHAEK